MEFLELPLETIIMSLPDFNLEELNECFEDFLLGSDVEAADCLDEDYMSPAVVPGTTYRS